MVNFETNMFSGIFLDTILSCEVTKARACVSFRISSKQITKGLYKPYVILNPCVSCQGARRLWE
jgi:hypothetical protein